MCGERERGKVRGGACARTRSERVGVAPLNKKPRCRQGGMKGYALQTRHAMPHRMCRSSRPIPVLEVRDASPPFKNGERERECGLAQMSPF